MKSLSKLHLSAPEAVVEHRAVAPRKSLFRPACAGLVTVFAAGLLTISSVQAALPLAVDDVAVPSLAPMLERVQTALVSVSAEATVQVRRDPFDDPFFRRFFDQRRTATRTREARSVGVVVDSALGYVLTNEHAVRGASKITITLDNGQKLNGILVGTDPTFDLAVVKIEPADSLQGLVQIEMGDSSALRVGDFVVSIGDPIGEQNTIVSGIVSASAKPHSLKQYQHFIQSDAAVGSGVLVDLQGRLVGLNIGQSTQTAANSRIGFSTPVDMAMKVQKQLVKYGTPQRGALAVRLQDLTQQLASAFDLRQTNGVVITSVTEGSAAQQAGLQTGDVVLKAGEQAVSNRKDLMTIIGHQFAGETLRLTVLRKGEQKLIDATLESSSRASKIGTLIHRQLEGATLNSLGAQKANFDGANAGVLVSKVSRGSVAWNHGIRPNDIITSVNRKPVNDLDSFRKAIADQDVLMLNILRGTGAMFVLLQ